MNAGVKRKEVDDPSEILKRKQIARQRWQILAKTLSGHGSSETQRSSVSVRRFHTFGLLKTHEIDSPVTDREEATWYSYICTELPSLRMKIRHVSETIRPEDLRGFNNTGNVCVWPAEEVMTYHCLQHVEDFRDSSVVELGGGMTCLAGVALAANADAKFITLTDGNEQSVNICTCLRKNYKN